MLLFGNAERSILTLLSRMKKVKTDSFENIKNILDLNSIEGVSFRVKKPEINKKTRMLPSYEECADDKQKFNLLTRTFYLLPDESFTEGCGSGFIQHNRQSHTLTEKEMDYVYDVPFTRKLHPNSKNL